MAALRWGWGLLYSQPLESERIHNGATARDAGDGGSTQEKCICTGMRAGKDEAQGIADGIHSSAEVRERGLKNIPGRGGGLRAYQQRCLRQITKTQPVVILPRLVPAASCSDLAGSIKGQTVKLRWAVCSWHLCQKRRNGRADGRRTVEAGEET